MSGDSDIPTKKSARQLDFVGRSGTGVEHSQANKAPTTFIFSPGATVVTLIPPLQSLAPTRLPKPESPKSKPMNVAVVEARDGTSLKNKNCDYKHSRCLKLLKMNPLGAKQLNQFWNGIQRPSCLKSLAVYNSRDNMRWLVEL